MKCSCKASLFFAHIPWYYYSKNAVAPIIHLNDTTYIAQSLLLVKQ